MDPNKWTSKTQAAVSAAQVREWGWRRVERKKEKNDCHRSRRVTTSSSSFAANLYHSPAIRVDNPLVFVLSRALGVCLSYFHSNERTKRSK